MLKSPAAEMHCGLKSNSQPTDLLEQIECDTFQLSSSINPKWICFALKIFCKLVITVHKIMIKLFSNLSFTVPHEGNEFPGPSVAT